MSESAVESDVLNSLRSLLLESPTSFHAVKWLEDLLSKDGFQELKETESWQITPGKSYYVKRNGSSLCAFRVPKKDYEKVTLIASHTDSPGFKLKPNAEFVKHNMLMLGLEMYGSPLINSWLNRNLGIAGRVFYRDKKGKTQESLFRMDEFPVVIPQLAIHLDRGVNENGLHINKQEHLAAIAAIHHDVASFKGHYVDDLIKQKLDCDSILATDLYLYPLEHPSLSGSFTPILSAYRLDNLCSVHASFLALLESPLKSSSLNMAIFWDNEEIGSETPQGANSPFFLNLLERITLAQDKTREEFLRLVSQSFCISVDCAHATHPSFPEKHEPNHPILLNEGVVIKSNAQQRYATDARSTATLMDICEKHQIRLQKMVTRGDIPCGTTIGPIHAHVTGMSTVDIGIPQLSMHSAREMIGALDYLALRELLIKVFKA